jgi:hypothetical protein
MRHANGADQMTIRACLLASALGTALALSPSLTFADPFFFSTGNPDGLMATASRPMSTGKIEIESADDFVLTSVTSLTNATFTGLIPTGLPLTSISDVKIEIYRVFPLDSTFPPDNRVPTRANSPSDVEFADRSFSAHTLTFTPSILSTSFSASNSVLNGIRPFPMQMTGGEGGVTGQEVQVSVSFAPPFILPNDHYFFVPQVQLASGDFFWLSSPRPIPVPPGTAFPAGFTDLQEWIRNDPLAPDWLRVGTDIVGGSPAPTFNATFSLTGQTIPEPSSLVMMGLGITGVVVAVRRSHHARSRRAAR